MIRVKNGKSRQMAKAKSSAGKTKTVKVAVKRKPLVKKQAAKKQVAKKQATKKQATKKQATRKQVVKKPASKKVSPQKTAAKKPAVKKQITKKQATKKPATKKVLAKKLDDKKTAAKKLARRKVAVKKTATIETPKSKTNTNKISSANNRLTLASLRAHVDDVEKRLKRADSLTRSSIKSLKSSYAVLAEKSGNGGKDLDAHIEALSDRLTQMIETTRKDVAHDLKIVLNDPRLETIGNALAKANKRLNAAEANQAEAINAINAHIARLASAFDEQLKQEKQERQQAEQKIYGRIDNVEEESAKAIRTIGDKFVSVSDELQNRISGIKQELAEDLLERHVGFQEEFEETKQDIYARLEKLEINNSERKSESAIKEAGSFGLGNMPANPDSPDNNVQVAPPIPVISPESPNVDMEHIAPNPYAPAPEIASYTNKQNEALSENSSATIGNETEEKTEIKEYVPQEYVEQKAQDLHASANSFAPQTPAYLAGQAVGQTVMQADYPAFENNTNTPVNTLENTAEAQANVYDFTPPPMPDQFATGQSGTEVQTTQFEPSMESVRPGVAPKSEEEKSKSVLSSPVLRVGMLTGFALIGLFAAKTIAPKFLGQEENTAPAMTQNANNEIVTPDMSAGNDTISPPPAQTVAPVGDYTKGQLAPVLDGEKSGEKKLTLQKAAISGNPIAQFQLGLSHLEAGRTAEAVRLIRLSANQGQPAAQYRLAKLYEAGIGVKVNHKTAKSLLEKSAKAGNRIAMHDLGHYYYTGADGSSPDLVKAVGWFTQAAERGVLDSQYNLGMLYHGGSGVERSLEEAYFWYSVAGMQGDKEAAMNAKNLEAEIDKEKLKKAKARVKAFTPKPVNNAANGIFNNLPWIIEAPKTAKKADQSSIKQAQKYLGKLGYDVGAPDGAMGPKTRQAIIRFETANGLPATGRVSAELLQRLALASGKA